MTIRTTLIATGLIAASLVTGAAHAALQGRDLDGNLATFEAYYDTDSDITWLANANAGAGSIYDDGTSATDGRMSWANANTWAANLSFTDGVNVYDDWRLPTVRPDNITYFDYDETINGTTEVGYNITRPWNEVAYMFYSILGNTGAFTTSGAPSDCYYSNCLVNVGPFGNLQPSYYWSATEVGYDPYEAWYFRMSDGYQNHGEATHSYAWAVSTGDVAAVPEAETYALMLAGLGLIGWRARRRG